jgi:ubiquinone/menaquinone biosynthesis C-methylase UbiE
MYNSNSDKELERSRYNQRALCLAQASLSTIPVGSCAVPLSIRAPYIIYENTLAELLTSHSSVLELCAGMGEHSTTLVAHSKHLTATDISSESLQILRKRFSDVVDLETRVCDIESLPFGPKSFDLVACAGGLSYADNQLVMNEIYRVLRPGGYFVCIDSLNNNPIYRSNRFIHYLRGRRSLSTLKRMPTLSLIRRYQKTFTAVRTTYHGCFSWLVSPFVALIGEKNTSLISDWLDSRFNLPSLAFKFVLVVQKPLAAL